MCWVHLICHAYKGLDIRVANCLAFLSKIFSQILLIHFWLVTPIRHWQDNQYLLSVVRSSSFLIFCLKADFRRFDSLPSQVTKFDKHVRKFSIFHLPSLIDFVMGSKTVESFLQDSSSFIDSALFLWLPLLILAFRSCREIWHKIQLHNFNSLINP